MSELLEQMKSLRDDHKPDGWPAVRMSEINALVGMIESQGEQLATLRERADKAEAEQHKRDIEQQIKGAYLVIGQVNETGQFGWSDCQWLSDYAEEFEEQLRKELEHG